MPLNRSSQPSDHLLLLPYAADPLAALAERLLHDHGNALPRLEHVTVLLPDSAEAPRLRRVLLQQAARLGYPALLGPQIQSWRSWLSRHEVTDTATVSDYRRELILLEALRHYRDLFGEANLWALADSLLTLFDELTLNRAGLPRDLSEFSRRVARGYGLQEGQLAPLEREAQLVHTLWHAWHQELRERRLIDRNTRYLLQLATGLEDEAAQPLYMVAPVTACEAEREWLGNMLHAGRITLLLHGHAGPATERRYHPEFPLRQLLATLKRDELRLSAGDEYSQLLDSALAFDPERDPPLRERAAAFARQVPQSPLSGRLEIHSADSDEEEAHAVELQVRRWLLEGRRHIGIVTENRRLARRVRALLERAGIALEDVAGWALSTTSAAAVLERWLQCVEEDFPHRAMLDLLKSPFFCTDELRQAHLSSVFRLEQDIVLHENIGSGLARYREHLKFRQQRLPDELAENLQPVAQLLEQLQQAAAPFQPHLHGGSSPATLLLERVLQSLDSLGIGPQLSADAAGMRLLEELHKMQQAVSEEKLEMDWLEFRSWLGRTLERYNFQPPANGQLVNLMGLSQSPLAHFDGLVIAGVEREHLPGTLPGTPFFNDAVRRELGLPVGDERLAERFYHFRRLLEAAPAILLTHRKHNDGEEIAPSPWLELLLAFHHQAYHDVLPAASLRQLLKEERNQVVQRLLPLPARSDMPQPSLPGSLLPGNYSASAYQQLLNCPYQFYAARGLGLAAPEAIREALEKSDYGERVHRCLQAFHGGVKGLPGPYTGSWEQKRRGEAIQLLEQISEAVFARDLEDNFLHRGWLQRWLEKIPDYIDWQLERAASWRVTAVEQQQEQLLDGLKIHGRLDRCDTDGEQLAIVDYKTGQSAAEEDILAGEAIQLPFYALLSAEAQRPVRRVEYLSLDGPRLGSKGVLEEAQLAELSQAVGRRLGSIHQQMLAGAPLPAWGDEQSCSYCSMSGVCRRQAWADNKKGD